MRKALFRVVLLVFGLAILPLASATQASTYVFTLTGPKTATFTLNSSPSPSSTSISSFELLTVAGTLNGSAASFNLDFFTSLYDGGFLLSPSSGSGVDLGGAQLFTGTLSSPTFTLGTFALSDDGFSTFKYSLTISDAAAAVPEPGTWAMMLLGFGAIALTVRRRKAAIPHYA